MTGEPLTLHIKKTEAQGSLILLICRDANGKRYTVQILDFKPYFYVDATQENLKTIRKRGLQFEDGLPTIYGAPTYKVIVDQPGSVPKRRKGFFGPDGTERSFEADVPYTRRFLIDTGIYDGFTVSNYRQFGDTVLASVHDLKPVSFRTKDRQMLYDIETNKPEGSKHYSPPLEADGAITAFSYHDNFDEGRIYTLTWHPEHGMVNRPKVENRSKWSDAYEREIPWIMTIFGSEIEMMDELIATMKRIRPDILQAWNGHHGHQKKKAKKGAPIKQIGFDAPYIINRLKKLGISPGQLSPMGNAFAGYKAFGKESTKGGMPVVNMDGVQLIDMMQAYELKDGGMTGQVPFSDLKRVTEKYTKKKLKKDPNRDFNAWWEHDFENFISYNFDDVDALVVLEKSQGYMEFTRETQNFVGVEDTNRVFTPMAMVTTLLLRIAKEDMECVPTANKSEEGDEDDDYTATGGFVMEPRVRGIQRRVGFLDLATMYVNNIVTANLSPETHVPDPTEEQMKDLICVPSDLGPQFFLKPSVRIGLLAKTVVRMKAMRKHFDDLIDAATDAEEIKKLKQKRQPAKQQVLAVWGVSLSDKFCLWKAEVGSSITGLGRFIHNNLDEETTRLGDWVVYGDTDSAAIPLPEKDPIEHGIWLAEQHQKMFDRLAKEINADTHTFEISLEKVYDPFLMGDTKKAYAGNIIWAEGKYQDHPVYEATGIQGIKSDAAPITKEASEAVIKALLAGAKPVDVMAYIKDMYDGVVRGDVPLSDVVKAIGLNLDIDDPKNASNYIVKGALYGRALYDFEYPPGGKVRVLHVKGKGEKWVAIPDTEDLPEDVNIDIEAHAEATVLRPLETLLSWVDLSTASVKHGTTPTKQKRL